MSRVLAGRANYPGLGPTAVYEPGLEHSRDDVQALVEAQTYVCAYYGDTHFGQIYPPEHARYTGEVYQTVAEFLCIPRHHCTGLAIALRAHSAVSTSTIKITAVEPAVSVEIAIDHGEANYHDVLPALDAEDTLVTIRVEAKCAQFTTYLDVLSIWCCDADMTEPEIIALP